jgi:hypothetical protein
VKRVAINLLTTFFNSYVILDTESMQNGASQNINVLFRSFNLAGRYLHKNLITVWLNHNKDLLSDSKTLAPDEYLILASNTFDKQRLILEKVPQVRMNNNRDPRTGVFLIEDVSKKPDFDFKLEQIMAGLKSDQIDFDYSHKKNSLIYDKNPQGRKKMLKMLETKNIKDFQGYLRDPELMVKLRETLNSASTLLVRTKINSENFSYLNYRDSTGLIQNVANLIKPNRSESGFARPETASTCRPKTRPQTSRTRFFRPLSGVSSTVKLVRPMTSVPKLKKPNALSLGGKSEPFHVMTLRESVSLSSLV